MAPTRHIRSLPSRYTSSNSKRCQKSKVVLKVLSCNVGQLEKCHNCNCRQRVNEKSELISQNVEVSKERWVALVLFCLISCSQCCIWNTWGPIASSVMVAFPTWQKYQVALLSDWGCITYLTFCVPCCWFLYREGLVTSIRMAAILTVLATFVRCISSQEKIFTITAHTAAILNGLSGVIVGPSTALVSAVWFPRGQRTTATGISSASNQFGMAISYLIGPAIVGVPFFSNVSSTIGDTSINVKLNLHEKHFYTTKSIRENADRMQTVLLVQIMSLMRIEFVAQFLILIGILSFFPKSSCPTIDCVQTGRLGLMKSLLCLINNKSMWQLSLAAALSQGVTGPWLTMVPVTFGSIITQEEADKIAFWTVIFGSTLSIIASRVTDIFQGHLKVAIYILLATSSAMFLWILLLDNQVLVFHKEELYVAIILGTSTSWSTPALFLELASEIAFPVSEAIVGGYMIFLANLIGTLFYFSYFIPEIGDYWANYCLFGNLATATVLVILVKEEYNRANTEFGGVYNTRCVQRNTKNKKKIRKNSST